MDVSRTRSVRSRYDFVVAGSGAGGAAVAGGLARSGAAVLLLEKGGAAALHDDAMEAVYRYYTDGGFVAAMGNAMIPIPTGTVLGGTTTINSGTCLKTPAALLERWEKARRGRFSKDSFEGYLEDAWAALKAKRAPGHTLSGPSKLVLAGLEALGIGTGEPLERAEDGCVGSGRCCFVCPSNGKMTSSKAFLDPLRGDPSLEVRPRTELYGVRPPRRAGEPVQVEAVSLKDRRIISVECGKLVLAAGALATPGIVRSCRLGRNWRRAGDGLSLHPAAKVFGHFDEPVRGWEGVPQGVGTVDPGDPAVRYEGVYTPPEMAAMTMPLEGLRLRWWMDRYHQVATFGFMIKDEARGKVRYPLGPSKPLIRYDMTPADVRRMSHAMRFVARIFFAAGARRVLLPLTREGNEVDGPGRLEDKVFKKARARELYSMAFHPLGTCAMGRVVDEDLRLCPGVYVCDGSVVPESLGVNPQITIYAFAFRLVEHLLRR